MKLKFTLLFALAAMVSLVMGAPIAAGLGVSSFMAGGLLLGGTALASVGTGIQGLTLNAAFTTTLLDNTYQANYHDGSKGLKDLHEKLYYGSEFDKMFSLQYTKLSVYDQGLVSSTEVTQAHQTAFTPKGGVEFKPSRSELERVKVDWTHSSDEIYGHWVGFLRKEGANEAEQTALISFILDIVAKQHVEDVELKACFKGVRIAPTPNVAGPASASLTGVRKKLNDGISATTITPITTGALATDAADFVTQIETFVETIPALDRNQQMTLAMDDALARRYRRGMRAKYNSQFLLVDELDKLIDNKNITVGGFQAMAGSSKIFCTPMENAVKAINVYDQNMAKARFNFQMDIRNLNVWMDYGMTYHFIDHGRVYCNEQAV